MLLDDFAKVATKIRKRLKKVEYRTNLLPNIQEDVIKLMEVLEEYEEHYGIK